MKGYVDPVHLKTTKETCFRDDEELPLVEHIDETGLQPDHRPPYAIAPANSKPQTITS
jgi:hypothetical protein